MNRCSVVYVDAFVYSACIFCMDSCHFAPLPCVTAIHGRNPREMRFVFVTFCLHTEQVAH